MSGIDFDFSEINALAADLGKVPAEVVPNIVKAVAVTALHIKDDWREAWSGSGHVPAGAAAITYEMKGGASLAASAVSAEIGPELKGQGPLVGMLEYGTPNTGPRGFGAEALHKNEPDFEKGILKAAGDIL
jgi:hypothetical protein